MAKRDDDLVVLTSASSEMQAALWVSVLESHGIAAMGPNAAATTLRWEVSSSDPFKVYVRRGDAARAKEVLARERADSVDIDWSEIDTGDTGDDPERAPPVDRERARGVMGGLVCAVIAGVLLVAILWGVMATG
jgi:hypothetical protein